MDHLGDPVGVALLVHQAVPGDLGMVGFAEMVAEQVGRNPVDPGGEGGLLAELGERLVDGGEGLGGEVFGGVEV